MARSQYQYPLREYLPRYGVKMRTVKQWIQIGRDASDPCPLDRPWDMPAWWQRNRRHPVPAKLWDAAGWQANGHQSAIPAGMPPAVATPPGVSPGHAPVRHDQGLIPVPAPVVVPDESAMPGDAMAGAGDEVEAMQGAMPAHGLDEEVERLELLAARLSVAAHKPGQTKPYLDTVGRLTALTAKLREEAERRRALIPRDEAETMIHEMHGPLEREIRLLIDPMAALLGVPVTPAFREKWSKECDRLCGRLMEAVFR